MSGPDDGLRSIIHRSLPDMHWQAIETGLTGGGVPDTNFCARGVEGWVECKATSATAVEVRPAQVGWTERRLRAGGRVFVAVRRRHDGGPRKGRPVDELWLYDGEMLRYVKRQGLLARPYRAVWQDGPEHWNWDAVREILLG